MRAPRLVRDGRVVALHVLVNHPEGGNPRLTAHQQRAIGDGCPAQSLYSDEKRSERMLRTHTCGQLTKQDVGKESTLCGWVQSRRDHGGVIFIDLRDRYGLTQVVFDPKHNASTHKAAEHIGREWVLKITGYVRPRFAGQDNPKMHTGEIEVITDAIDVLNQAETPPLEIEDAKTANEELRLKYRYLDLRRPVMQHHLLFRHKAAQAAREYLSSQSFMEIETPMFVKTTPGGARVFKVPSRVHPGHFYALPESPQIYKQLLMVAGCDRYFQLARCMRDEDLRMDRQPEFTQIDLEMSYVDEQDVQNAVEGLLKHTFKKCLNIDVPTPFPRLTFHDAMTRFGSDKPDTRFGLELCDVTEECKHSDFNVFKSLIDKKGVVHCLNAKKCAIFSRNEIDELIEVAKTHHLAGLAWMKLTDKGLDGSIVKYFKPEVQQQLIKATKAEIGDLLLFAAEQFEKCLTALGQVRLHIGEKLGLIDKSKFNFLWVVDFPSYEWNEDEDCWQARHHIFTAPKDADVDKLESDPGSVHAKAYDIVLNGTEVGGGSVRIHRKDLQARVLKVIGLTYEQAEQRFDFLMNAFKYGAPPHGGIALGFDRLVTLMNKENDIREFMAFPKNKNMQNPLDGSPQPWEDRMLKELSLKLDVVKKETKP